MVLVMLKEEEEWGRGGRDATLLKKSDGHYGEKRRCNIGMGPQGGSSFQGN